MKLSRFITEHLDEIVGEWETFARSLEHFGSECSGIDLRDHAKEMLQAIALDMETQQNPSQKKDKSVSEVSEINGGPTPASAHGALRQTSGFTLPQVTAEFRAMRASVLRLWLNSVTKTSKVGTEEILRFNEAIDQALQESAITFADQTARTRDTFLAMLGHDLRSPLATMSMAGVLLTNTKEGTEHTLKIGARVKRSAATMTTMVNDLLGYARTQLGGQIPIKPVLGDMRDICHAAVDDASAAHPECAFDQQYTGDMIGDFDGERVQQVISNLLNNAAQYRSATHPVTVFVSGEKDALTLQVKNFGAQIPDSSLKAIFDPLVQLSVSAQQKGRSSTSLGLGLFIAREITVAHGGTISAESSDSGGTVFTVQLPRSHQSVHG